jgi:N-acetylglutamate synthase-like GNAT family acetyltransferase
MIIYRQISTEDHEYDLEKELRNRVLRLPLGLQLSEHDLRDEEKQVHLVAMNSQGHVIGCVLVAFYKDMAKIRQIAIEASYRSRGIGTELIKRAEKAIHARNVRMVTLHARLSACGFFEGLGYTAASDVFTEVTIPHVSMGKNITP